MQTTSSAFSLWSCERDTFSATARLEACEKLQRGKFIGCHSDRTINDAVFGRDEVSVFSMV